MTDTKTKRLIEAAKDVLLEWDGGPMSEGGAYYRLEKAVAELQPEPDYLHEPIDSREKAGLYLGCPCEAGFCDDEWLPRTVVGWSLVGDSLVAESQNTMYGYNHARVRFRRLREGDRPGEKDHWTAPGYDGWRLVNNAGAVRPMNAIYRRLVNHDGSDFDWGSLK